MNCLWFILYVKITDSQTEVLTKTWLPEQVKGILSHDAFSGTKPLQDTLALFIFNDIIPLN